MVNLKKLRVSQTKNGYQKIADLIVAHPRGEILASVCGVHPGINLEKSQVANILGAGPGSERLPAYWDEIRSHGKEAIESFSLVAVLFSHYGFIEALLRAHENAPVGYLLRSSMGEKAYTNLVYALAERGLCTYTPGSPGTVVKFAPLVARLSGVGGLVRSLLRDKLARCGWLDPASNAESEDLSFMETCITLRFHELFGLPEVALREWLA